MCGIVGSYDLSAATPSQTLRARVEAMSYAVRHRGPDDNDIWVDAAAGIAFGHRRLAIRDLSPEGRQPMTSSCGRFVIVYNGEIYSQREIIADLRTRGRSLRGHSDTEVILEACAEWGVRTTVDRLIGMFAFGLFDRQSRTLTLARDRLGIKPVYWTKTNEQVLFGSELKALKAADAMHLRIDRNALASYLRYNYVPTPDTIYEGVKKLAPGSILVVEPTGDIRGHEYWSIAEVSRRPRIVVGAAGDRVVLEQLDDLLVDAVRRRLVSDVPIGSLLSGGIDSSLVSALMVETSQSAVQTFTVGFDDPRYDESDYAREIARHLGTEHHELVAQPADAMRLIDEIPQYFDEPFADVSQLPTMLVSELTKREVSVVLSGDGGDELFGGYSRYAVTSQAWHRARRLPPGLRRLAGRALTRTPGSVLDGLASLLPARHRRAGMGDKLHQLGAGMRTGDLGPMYDALLTHWSDPDGIVIGANEARRTATSIPIDGPRDAVLDAMRREDMQHYLPDDILTKVDRASMRVSLEARIPLLDHRLVEFAWTLPTGMIVRDGVTKWPLRQALHRRVPQSLVDRPKMGFGVPIGDWLRGPLRAWAQDLLDPQQLAAQGLLDAHEVRATWDALLRGEPCEYRIWDVLVLQMWLNENPTAIS